MKSNFSGKELQYVEEALKTGLIASDGPFVERFDERLAEELGLTHVMACSSAPVGWALTFAAAGIRAGDYVVTPNAFNPTAAAAIKRAGADPIFMDLDAHTLQVDLNLLETFLGVHTYVNDCDELVLKRDQRRIKALLPIHSIGGLADMDQLLFIARRYHLLVLEDASDALGARFSAQVAGTFGAVGLLGLCDNQLITAGGGCILIVNDETVAHRLSSLAIDNRDEGKPAFRQRKSYGPHLPNILAGIGLAQVEELPAILVNK